MSEAKQNLDGKTPIKPTPFDAHEQRTRGEHVPTTANGPEPKTTGQEYPKAVDHVQKNGAPEGHSEPVLVKSADEEKAYEAKKTAEAKSE